MAYAEPIGAARPSAIPVFNSPNLELDRRDGSSDDHRSTCVIAVSLGEGARGQRNGQELCELQCSERTLINLRQEPLRLVLKHTPDLPHGFS